MTKLQLMGKGGRDNKPIIRGNTRTLDGYIRNSASPPNMSVGPDLVVTNNWTALL